MPVIALTVNGVEREARSSRARLLADFLREELGLTGTHVGCEHGVCGACTVLLDGEPVRSCLMLAVQADGAEVDDGRGPRRGRRRAAPAAAAFHEHHGLQCGFCTPGFLMTASSFYRDANP